MQYPSPNMLCRDVPRITPPQRRLAAKAAAAVTPNERRAAERAHA
jgi:hypothetical protein